MNKEIHRDTLKKIAQNPEAFILAVMAMREAQKSYFAKRTIDALELSKRLERLIDATLNEKPAPNTLFS